MLRHQSRLEGLGRNLTDLAQAGMGAALALTALGLMVPRSVVGVIFGEPHKDCRCSGRHHSCCCYDPPIYGCER